MRIKKGKKSKRMRGSRTHGWAMKKHKGSGNYGGKGFAGTGKRADQKKSYIIKYHFPYFGKKGFTSKATAVTKSSAINVGEIESNIQSMVAKGKAKQQGKTWDIDLKEYKILAKGEVSLLMNIHARAASKTAIDKVEKAGGKILLAEEKAVKE